MARFKFRSVLPGFLELSERFLGIVWGKDLASLFSSYFYCDCVTVTWKERIIFFRY